MQYEERNKAIECYVNLIYSLTLVQMIEAQIKGTHTHVQYVCM